MQSPAPSSLEQVKQALQAVSAHYSGSLDYRPFYVTLCRAALSAVEALGQAEPVAWMWQHDETGNTGFVQHASAEDLAQWERMNRPRRIVTPLYASPAVVAHGLNTTLVVDQKAPNVSDNAALQQQEAGSDVVKRLLFDIQGAMLRYGTAFKSEDQEGIRRTTTEACDLLDRLAALACAPSPTEPKASEGVAPTREEPAWLRCDFCHQLGCANPLVPRGVGASEIERLRAEQAAGVMPQIGPLLDAWDGMDNDTKAVFREEAPDLARALVAIGRAMDGADGVAVPRAPECRDACMVADAGGYPPCGDGKKSCRALGVPVNREESK